MPENPKNLEHSQDISTTLEPNITPKEAASPQPLDIFIVESSASKTNLGFEFAFRNWNDTLIAVDLKAAEFSKPKALDWEYQLNAYQVANLLFNSCMDTRYVAILINEE